MKRDVVSLSRVLGKPDLWRQVDGKRAGEQGCCGSTSLSSLLRRDAHVAAAEASAIAQGLGGLHAHRESKVLPRKANLNSDLNHWSSDVLYYFIQLRGTVAI